MEKATYWDSSALIAAAIDPSVREKLASSERSITRTHALAEIFSTVTGGRLGFRLGADDATSLLTDLSHHLAFVDLSPEETLETLANSGEAGPTAHCLLPTAYCLLPTAHCPLPTAHCPLPTAHCPLAA